MINQGNITPELREAARRELARRQAARADQEQSQAMQQAQQPAQQSSNPQNMLLRGGADLLAGIAQAGQGIESTPYNLAKTLGASPQTLSRLPQPTNIDIGKTFGVKDPNIVDKIIQGIGTYAPAAALSGPGILGQTLAGGATGFTQSKNPFIGATEGAAGGAIFGALPEIPGIAKAIAKPFSADKYAETLLNDLSQGRHAAEINPLEQTGQSIAKDILNKKAQEQAIASAPYQTLSNILGDKPIYDPINNISTDIKRLGEAPEVSTKYLDLEPDIIKKTYGADLKLMHNKFLENPTFDNAHQLQSQLGSEIRQLDKMKSKLGALPQAERNLQDTYKYSRSNLLDDINSFLNNKNPSLGNMYKRAAVNYADKISKFYDNPQISKIVGEAVTNPRNVSNLFKNPEPETKKLVDVLGDDFKKKIIYSDIAKTPNLNATKILNNFGKLDSKGLGSYITSDMTENMGTLEDILKRKNLLKKVSIGAGLLAGGGALSKIF